VRNQALRNQQPSIFIVTGFIGVVNVFPRSIWSAFTPTVQCTLMTPPAECTTIEEVRQGIDTLDRAIIEALGRRFEYVKAVTRFKKTAEDVAAPIRYQQVIETRRAWAAEFGLNPDAIEKMYRDLIAHFIEEELKLLNVERRT
jgi:isochorismate pyruvate lyase